MSRSLLRLSSVAALVLALSISGQHCRAMDRWAALSQLESGDDDSVRGAAGEVSRYQVRPEIWEQYAEAKMNWRAPADALLVAQRIMKHRCAEFERAFRRQPNDFEFYILWNAPARIGDPAKAVRERAARFSNLVSKPGYIRTLPRSAARGLREFLSKRELVRSALLRAMDVPRLRQDAPNKPKLESAGLT